jgi:thymidylate kinase
MGGLMSNSTFKIGLVGVCGAGKTTLTNGLKPYYTNVRQIAQEHSYVRDMWSRLAKPDILIYLDASFSTTLQRKQFNWNEQDYQKQIQRLQHARQHADLKIDTDNLSPNEILDRVLDFLNQLSHSSGGKKNI